MPPRKATSSTTPAEADESSSTTTQQPTATATEQQMKAQTEGGVSVEVWHLFSITISYLGCMRYDTR